MSPFKVMLKTARPLVYLSFVLDFYLLLTSHAEGKYRAVAVIAILTIVLSFLIGLARALVYQQRRYAMTTSGSVHTVHTPLQDQFQSNMDSLNR